MTGTNYRIFFRDSEDIFCCKKDINKTRKFSKIDVDYFSNLKTTINYMEKNKICGFIASDGGSIRYVKNFKNTKGVITK